jgi:hypothetical protein
MNRSSTRFLAAQSCIVRPANSGPLSVRSTNDGWPINVKRTYGIYREESLMVRKRRGKKLRVPDRQPLLRPLQPNEVWSMDLCSASWSMDARSRR